MNISMENLTVYHKLKETRITKETFLNLKTNVNLSCHENNIYCKRSKQTFLRNEQCNVTFVTEK